jgi:integrase/recombinase XerD
MSVHLRKKENADNTVSLYLDIYHSGKRSYEFLKGLKILKPARTAFDRQTNKQNLQLAEQIRVKRSQELEANDYNVTPNFKSKVDFISYFENFANKYPKKDKRVILAALYKFKEFLKETGRKSVSALEVDEALVFEFKEYLESTLNGESPANYFSKFKRVLKQGARDKILQSNPASDVTIKKKEGIKKDTLTIVEIQELVKTPSTNDQVKKAFIFSCYTGLPD